MNKLGTILTGIASLFSFSAYSSDSLKIKTINVTKLLTDFIAVERGDHVRPSELSDYIDRNFTEFEITEIKQKLGLNGELNGERPTANYSGFNNK